MNSVDIICNSISQNNDIQTFGKNHLLLSLIPVVSLIVERAMFMRAEGQLLAEMIEKEKILFVDKMHVFKDIPSINEFKNRHEREFLKIAGWHLMTGIFQAIPWALMFGLSPLPRVCFAILYVSHVWLLAELGKTNFGYGSSGYTHLSQFS